MMKLASNIRMIGVASVALVGVSFGGVAISAMSEEKARPVEPAKQPVAAPSDAMRASFSVFRTTERNSEDAVPRRDNFARAIAATGVALDHAQRIPISTARSLWAAPSEDGFCYLHMPDDALAPGKLCYAESVALEGRAWATLGTVEGEGADLIALVPDGVESARVTFVDGTTTEVPVSHNTLFLHTRRHTESYSYVDGEQTSTVRARTFDG